MILQFEKIDDANARIIGFDFVRNETVSSNEIVFDDALPSNVPLEFGKSTNMIINLNSKVITVEYVDRPLTSDEELQQLKDKQALMQSAIDDLILGGAL